MDCKVTFDQNSKFIAVEGQLPSEDGVRLAAKLEPEDMVAISKYYNHSTEFALARELKWQLEKYIRTENYWLFSGNAGFAEVTVPFDDPVNGIDGFELIYHTHPGGNHIPSGADNIDITARNVQFGQERSGIIPIGIDPLTIFWFDKNTPYS